MKKTLISGLALLSCNLYSFSVEPSLHVRHRDGGGVGYSQGYTTVDLFFRGNTETAEYLLDLRGHLFNNGRSAANAGVGFRYPIGEDDYLLGVNAFYDWRSWAHQVGCGLESINKYFDVRMNGYIPVGKKQHYEQNQFQGFSGNSVMVHRKIKAALPCMDLEVGTPLPDPFYFALGTYYLFEKEHHDLKVGGALGVKARAEVYIGYNLTIGGTLTYDHIFHTRLEGLISFKIPFGHWKILREEERPLRKVRIMRNEIIPLKNKRKSKSVLMGGVDGTSPVRFLFVDNRAAPAGNGTFEKPFASLKDAQDRSKKGDVIYVFPGDKTPKNYDQGIELKKDQILASSGAPLKVQKIEIPAQTPGVSPKLTNRNQKEPIVKNPGNSRLNDFIFIPPPSYILGKWNTASGAGNSGAAASDSSSTTSGSGTLHDSMIGSIVLVPN